MQAPLCSPTERTRRLATVCFERCMAQAQQAPEAASWLPLEIYRSNSCDLTQLDSCRSTNGLESSGAPQCSQAGGWEGAPQLASSPGSSSATPAELTALGDAMHGLPDADPVMLDDPLVDLDAAGCSSEDGAADGDWQSLRHGWMVGDLGAHWSAWYGECGAAVSGRVSLIRRL